VKATEKKKFELSTTGWGTFDLPITIHWSKASGLSDLPQTIDHHLSFNGEGKWKTITLKIGKEKLIKIYGEQNIQHIIDK